MLWRLPKLVAGASVGSCRCSSLYLTPTRQSPWGGTESANFASSLRSRDARINGTMLDGTASLPAWSNNATYENRQIVKRSVKKPGLVNRQTRWASFSKTLIRVVSISNSQRETMVFKLDFHLRWRGVGESHTMFRTCRYKKPVPSTSSCKRGPYKMSHLVSKLYISMTFSRKDKIEISCQESNAFPTVSLIWHKTLWNMHSHNHEKQHEIHIKRQTWQIIIIQRQIKLVCLQFFGWNQQHVISIKIQLLSRCVAHSHNLNSSIWKKKMLIDMYHFDYVKAKNYFYWIWYPIISWCIAKSRKVMLPYEMLSSIPHDISIKLVHTMVSIVSLKWIHDGIIEYLVTINLACHREASMKFR